jgi:hypothetical protein
MATKQMVAGFCPSVVVLVKLRCLVRRLAVDLLRLLGVTPSRAHCSAA